VAQDRIGIFDSIPSRGEVRLGIAIVGLLLLVSMALLPFRHQPIGEVTAFLPSIYSVIFVGELIIGTMLFAQANIFRSRALTALASGFVFNAFLLIPYLLTFPGIFSASGLLGAGINSAAWMMACRRLAFPISVILYVLLRRRETGEVASQAAQAPVLTALVIAIVMAVTVAIIAVIGEPYLPPLFQNRTEGAASNLLAFNLVNLALALLAAGALLFRARPTLLETWLLVSLALWLVQSVLNLPLQARFTLGWYSLQLTILSAHLCVLVALIMDSNRLYARLAISTARERRERDGRLLTLDAVASAISHEVGQPLTAVTLNAAASLNWLTQKPPRIDRAMNALQDTKDAGQRAFEVIQSVREAFRKGSGTLTEISVNRLVLDTAGLFERELATEKISLEVTLDDASPVIVAHRVQIQRVIINLLTNAIESVRASSKRMKSVVVRTSADGSDAVLISISDNGEGISAEKLPHIFEPFFTTKSKGTGLGLSLSRTIIEEHAGQMWASSDLEHCTFYVRLPRCGRTVGRA